MSASGKSEAMARPLSAFEGTDDALPARKQVHLATETWAEVKIRNGRE